VRPEELCQWKIPMTPSGIEPATFQLVAQCLKRLRYRLKKRLLFKSDVYDWRGQRYTEKAWYMWFICTSSTKVLISP
jgi:hypothetical protein